MVGPKAQVYLNEEQRNQLRVLTRTPGVPTHLIAIRTDLDKSLIEKIKTALLSLTKNSPELLSDVYGAANFVETEQEKHIAGAIKALENTGLHEKNLVK